MKRYIFAALLIFIHGCAKIPSGIEPISGFDVDRYLGKWYEIARFDHSFERGLSNISAEYSLRKDGDIRVLNNGYNVKKGQWQQAEGRAKFMGQSDIGSIKVSFFGPFYGAYNIIELDKERYQYAMVTGNNRSYFWILSRTPELATEIKQQLLKKAARLKFPMQDLIYVDQNLNKHNNEQN